MSLDVNQLTIIHLGQTNYADVFAAMQAATQKRIDLKLSSKHRDSAGNPRYERLPDELWLCQHASVYTLGLAGKREHILQTTNTPIIQTDRGGQVTWHGTGQLVAYFLYDLNVLGWHVRDLVTHAEELICQLLDPLLASANLKALPLASAPGVYVFATGQLKPNLHNHLGKIASVGFKIRHGFSYHGIAINLNADLSAFDNINPCGYTGLKMINLSDLLPKNTQIGMDELASRLGSLAQCQHQAKTS